MIKRVNEHIIKDIKKFLVEKGKLKYEGEDYTSKEIVNGIDIWITPNFKSSKSFEKKADDIIKKVSELKRRYNLVDNTIVFSNNLNKTKHKTKFLVDVEFSMEWSYRSIRFKFSDIDDSGPIPKDIEEKICEDIERKFSKYKIELEKKFGHIKVEIKIK